MMDIKTARLLSDFFLDISKAYFISGFVAPYVQQTNNSAQIMIFLIRSFLNVIMCLLISRLLLEVRNLNNRYVR